MELEIKQRLPDDILNFKECSVNHSCPEYCPMGKYKTLFLWVVLPWLIPTYGCRSRLLEAQRLCEENSRRETRLTLVDGLLCNSYEAL